ncbi:MAG: polyketide cyclase [Nitratireductor sp.]|jgi:uncharacterized protein YndB with AHSA1/START domain|nr:polyketide cyclase [Nitratireductor sp.]
MTTSATETRCVVVEREVPHPPEKIWRALTQPHLIAEWLMKNNFEAREGHRFSLTASWGKVDCEVQTIEPHSALTYAWNTKDLRSVVRWTLTPTETGTLLRMEQEGFQPGQKPYFQGATAAWPRFIAALERVVDQLG